MTRLTRILLIAVAALGLALLAGACGTEHIGPPKSDPNFATDQAAATLFNQHCGGCHTLAVAGTQGSGDNPRTYLDISGPDFNVRCEKPAIRVMYAITNGGFYGGYMPQNIITGHDAQIVANFVAKWSGRDAPLQPGEKPCIDKPTDPITGIPTPAQSAALVKDLSKSAKLNPSGQTTGALVGTSTSGTSTSAGAATGTSTSGSN